MIVASIAGIVPTSISGASSASGNEGSTIRRTTSGQSIANTATPNHTGIANRQIRISRLN